MNIEDQLTNDAPRWLYGNDVKTVRMTYSDGSERTITNAPNNVEFWHDFFTLLRKHREPHRIVFANEATHEHWVIETKG